MQLLASLSWHCMALGSQLVVEAHPETQKLFKPHLKSQVLRLERVLIRDIAQDYGTIALR